jgi:hypothetical protein
MTLCDDVNEASRTHEVTEAKVEDGLVKSTAKQLAHDFITPFALALEIPRLRDELKEYEPIFYGFALNRMRLFYVDALSALGISGAYALYNGHGKEYLAGIAATNIIAGGVKIAQHIRAKRHDRDGSDGPCKAPSL